MPRVIVVALIACLMACVMAVAAAGCAAAAEPGRRDVLWAIVAHRCVPDQIVHGNPAPCRLVDLSHGRERGWALLKDLRGPAQFLLIPTARITGIEDPRLLARGAPNYWQAAWQERDKVAARAGLPAASERIGLAVNSALGRTQDQLHIHIDCLRPATIVALRTAPASPHWSPVVIAGRAYATRAIAADSLRGIDVFGLVAARARALGVPMAWETVAVAATRGRAGRQLLHVLVATVSPRQPFGAEELLDHTCGGRGR